MKNRKSKKSKNLKWSDNNSALSPAPARAKAKVKPKAKPKPKPKAKIVKAKPKTAKKVVKAKIAKSVKAKPAKAKKVAAKKLPTGVPQGMTLDVAAKWVEPRVSKKRFAHIAGVAMVGRDLAILAEVDPLLVGLACWLHDACKEMKETELLSAARKFGMTLTAHERASGHLLHGPVAAQTIKRELKISNREVLNAMSEHTLGAVGMSRISKVVFLADCLEASRSENFTRPIWQALGIVPGRRVQTIDLDAAMLVACDLSLAHLLNSRRPIHPRTVDVRNHFLGIVRAAEKSGA